MFPLPPAKPDSCAITDCPRPREKREWCGLHYERWRQHGDPLALKRAPNGTYSAGAVNCSVDNCDRSVKTRGLCGMHYQRYQSHGDPLVVLPLGRKPTGKPPAQCVIDGCDRPVCAREMCKRHYYRQRSYGRTELQGVAGALNPMWKGAEAGYNAKHARVQRVRGKAGSCVWGCTGVRAYRYEWANLTGDYDDPDDYAPMCTLCHRRYDRALLRTAQDN